MLLVGVRSALWSGIASSNIPDDIKNASRPFSKQTDQIILEPGIPFAYTSKTNTIIEYQPSIEITSTNIKTLAKTFAIEIINIGKENSDSYAYKYNPAVVEFNGKYYYAEHHKDFGNYAANDGKLDLRRIHDSPYMSSVAQLYSTNSPSSESLNVNSYLWRLQTIVNFYDNAGWYRNYIASNNDAVNSAMDLKGISIIENKYNDISGFCKKSKSDSVISSKYILKTNDFGLNKSVELMQLLVKNNLLFNNDFLDSIINELNKICASYSLQNPWYFESITNTKNVLGSTVEINPTIISNQIYNQSSNNSSLSDKDLEQLKFIIEPQNLYNKIKNSINSERSKLTSSTYDFIYQNFATKADGYYDVMFKYSGQDDNYLKAFNEYLRSLSGNEKYINAGSNEYSLKNIIKYLYVFTDIGTNTNINREKMNKLLSFPNNSPNSDELCNNLLSRKGFGAILPFFEVYGATASNDEMIGNSYALVSASTHHLLLTADFVEQFDISFTNITGIPYYNSVYSMMLHLIDDDIYLNHGFFDNKSNMYMNYLPIDNLIDMNLDSSSVPAIENSKLNIKPIHILGGPSTNRNGKNGKYLYVNGGKKYYIGFIPRRYGIISLESVDPNNKLQFNYELKSTNLICKNIDTNEVISLDLRSDDVTSKHNLLTVFKSLASDVESESATVSDKEKMFEERLIEWARLNGGIFTIRQENSYILLPCDLEYSSSNTNGYYTIISEEMKPFNETQKRAFHSLKPIINAGTEFSTDLISSNDYAKDQMDSRTSKNGFTDTSSSNIRKNTVNDEDMLYMDDESLYKGTALNQDTLVNENFIAQSLRSVIGLPFQFMPHVDPRIYADYSAISGKGGGYGYHFIDKIIYDLPIAIIKPGQPRAENSDLLSAITGSLDALSPERLIEFQTAAKRKVALLSSSGITSIIGTIGGALNAVISGNTSNFVDSLETIFFYLQTRYQRLYTWAGDSAHYIQYVNTLCHLFITFLGIGDMDYIDGHGNTRKYRNYDDSWIVLNQQDDRSLFSVNGESREGFANSEDSELYTINSIFGEDPAVYIFYNAETRTGDMFSNSMQESMISGLNSVSDQSKQIHFLSGIGGQGATNIFNLASNTVHSLAGSLGDALGSGVLGSLFQNVAEGIDVIIAGNNFDVPQMWSDSSHSTDVSISFKLASPSGDLESIFLYILRPLARVLAFSLPRQYVTNSYTSPFIIQAFAKGMFNVQLGVVESLSISRGGDGTKSYTITNLPTELNVQLTIKDMYEKIALSNEYRHDGTIFDLFPDLSGGNTFAGFGLSGLISKLTTGDIDTFTKVGSAIKTSVETTASNFRSFGYLLNNIGLIDFCASYTGFNLNNPAGRLQSYLFRNMIANRYKDIVDVSFDDGDVDIAFPSWERRKADILDNVFLSKSRLIKG